MAAQRVIVSSLMAKWKKDDALTIVGEEDESVTVDQDSVMELDECLIENAQLTIRVIMKRRNHRICWSLVS